MEWYCWWQFLLGTALRVPCFGLDPKNELVAVLFLFNNSLTMDWNWQKNFNRDAVLWENTVNSAQSKLNYHEEIFFKKIGFGSKASLSDQTGAFAIKGAAIGLLYYP